MIWGYPYFWKHPYHHNHNFDERYRTLAVYSGFVASEFGNPKKKVSEILGSAQNLWRELDFWELNLAAGHLLKQISDVDAALFSRSSWLWSGQETPGTPQGGSTRSTLGGVACKFCWTKKGEVDPVILSTATFFCNSLLTLSVSVFVDKWIHDWRHQLIQSGWFVCERFCYCYYCTMRDDAFCVSFCEMRLFTHPYISDDIIWIHYENAIRRPCLVTVGRRTCPRPTFFGKVWRVCWVEIVEFFWGFHVSQFFGTHKN